MHNLSFTNQEVVQYSACRDPVKTLLDVFRSLSLGDPDGELCQGPPFLLQHPHNVLVAGPDICNTLIKVPSVNCKTFHSLDNGYRNGRNGIGRVSKQELARLEVIFLVDP